MKKQLIRISVLQSSKIVTAFYVVMGLIYTLIGIPMVAFGSGQVRTIGIVYVFMPIITAVVGFIFFCAFAFIYNVLANRLGGVEVEVKDVEDDNTRTRELA